MRAISDVMLLQSVPQELARGRRGKSLSRPELRLFYCKLGAEEVPCRRRRIFLDAVGIRDDPLSSQGAAHRRASTIVENCTHIHCSLSTLIRELRPTGLDELGLAAALEHCVETWRVRLPGVSLRLSISGDFTTLPETITVTLYRLVQEALTNVAKHAAANHVAVRLERVGEGGVQGERIDVTIVDNGVGSMPRVSTRGLGLIGMRERVMALQGRLVFTSLPGQGFELSAQIPVPPHEGHIS